MLATFATLLELPLVRRDPFEPLDAIVVLGAPLGPGDTLTAILAERVTAAAQLFRMGGGPIVIATGGVTGAGRAEADVLAEGLVAAGIPAAVMIAESASRTTAENARLTAAIVVARGLRRVWLVSQPYHGRRAAYLFARAGLEPRVWHIASSLEYADRRRAVRWLLREYAAWGLLVSRALLGRRA